MSCRIENFSCEFVAFNQAMFWIQWGNCTFNADSIGDGMISNDR